MQAIIATRITLAGELLLFRRSFSVSYLKRSAGRIEWQGPEND
jgi:hypothetical protein